MRKITLLLVLLLAVWTSSQAKQVNLNSSQGVDQDIIISLYPSPSNVEVAKDAIIKIVFDVKLDERHIKKNDIKLREISNRKKKIRGSVSYIQTEQAITFKPKYSLNVGFYELSITSLKTTKEYKNQKIKKIKYYFYVPEVINGYMLPIEPDEKLNNSTLLGIDSNDNGVRDDVERKIIKTYLEPIKIELMMAYSKVAQMILENPVGLAIEHSKKMDKISDCEMYLETYNQGLKDSFDFFENNTFNTKQRVRAYLDHNLALSGGVYGSSPADWNAEACDFKVEEMLKDIK